MADTAQIKAALLSTETSAVVLNAILQKQYGDDVYDWDPLTVYLELKSDYNVDPSSEVLDRIGAIQVIMTTDAFFTRLDAFSAICNTLSNGDPYFVAFDPVTTEEAAWGVTEVALLRDLLPFEYAIKEYMHNILNEDGYTPETYPEAIQIIFDDDPKQADIKQAMLAGEENRGIVEQYVDEEMQDVIYQFNSIPSLKMDDYIFDGSKLAED